MGELAIRVAALSKLYHVGHGASYFSLRESLARLPRRLLGRRAGVERRDELWALRDVSFAVRRGEVLGVIGRNGAGKSTLLKILSRITHPTAGRAEVWGRVGSLLEVGTGFHPELTGRENVYLNGAILGMKRAEIDRKYDAIVGFAEIDRFLDTPVKHYSSGMYMRLAFAVAAHLETEILLVDEVLAVGDAEFQKKCLGKMEDVHRQDRAVLFVSHNLAAVERVCSRVMVLDRGCVRFVGEPGEGVRAYLALGDGAVVGEWRNPEPVSGRTQVLRAFLCDANGAPNDTPDCASAFGVVIELAVGERLRELVLAMAVCNQYQVPVFSTSPADVGVGVPLEPGRYRTKVLFPAGLLMPKGFSLIISLYNRWQSLDSHSHIVPFQVQAVASVATATPTGRLGDVFAACAWSAVERLPDEPARPAL
jgi:lipopolysaccharide transport system ATP-binding protein